MQEFARWGESKDRNHAMSEIIGFGKAIQQLIQIGGSPIGNAAHIQIAFESTLVGDLVKMLSSKNGFFAFESALHIFHFGTGDPEYGVVEWNQNDLWRRDYGDMADGLLFFAEDIFGGQFAINAEEIIRFDPETGERTCIALSFESWAARILGDYDFETGYSLANAWQKKFGRLPARTRLIPKVPFVLGGDFDVSNLQAIESARGMRLRANLACQIRDLPDGAQIRFEIT